MDNEKQVLDANLQNEFDKLLLEIKLKRDETIRARSSFAESKEKWYFSATNALLAGNSAATVFSLKILSDSDVNKMVDIAVESITYFMVGILIIVLNYPLTLIFKIIKETDRLLQSNLNMFIEGVDNFSKLKALGFDPSAISTGRIAYYSSLQKTEKAELKKHKKKVRSMEFILFITVLASGTCFFQGVLNGLLFVTKVY